MDLIERLQAALVDSGVPLTREALVPAAERAARTLAPLADGAALAAVVDGLVGLGPLETLLRDPEVTDVFVNRPDEVWAERAGALTRAEVTFESADALLASVQRVIASLGLRLDTASPIIDARLADGSRLHAAIPPVAVDGPIVAIRRFTATVRTLGDLVAAGSISAGWAAALAQAVDSRQNVLVSGGTGAGKTTLLNVLSQEIPIGERTVTVEDAAELRLAGHVLRLEARPPNAEGFGAIDLETLVRAALRLRPDRIVVGEVRGPEALDLINAMNTGHAGSMSTVHANSPADALSRLEILALSGERRVNPEVVRRQLWSAIDVIVHVERRHGRRRVAALARVGRDELQEVSP